MKRDLFTVGIEKPALYVYYCVTLHCQCPRNVHSEQIPHAQLTLCILYTDTTVYLTFEIGAPSSDIFSSDKFTNSERRAIFEACIPSHVAYCSINGASGLAPQPTSNSFLKDSHLISMDGPKSAK